MTHTRAELDLIELAGAEARRVYPNVPHVTAVFQDGAIFGYRARDSIESAIRGAVEAAAGAIHAARSAYPDDAATAKERAWASAAVLAAAPLIEDVVLAEVWSRLQAEFDALPPGSYRAGIASGARFARAVRVDWNGPR